MTLKEVRLRVEAIRAMPKDTEKTHEAEDKLYQDVLKAIAEGTDYASALARTALETQAIVLQRWYS